MKSAAFAIALLMSGAAIAQTDPEMTTKPATETAMPVEADMSGPGQIVAPGNTDPEHDARGIAVISDSATAPAGFNLAAPVPGTGGPFIAVSAPTTAQPATQDYPACTREVTDNCVQTYERGRSPQ